MYLQVLSCFSITAILWQMVWPSNFNAVAPDSNVTLNMQGLNLSLEILTITELDGLLK